MNRRTIILDEIGVGPLWTRRDAAAASFDVEQPAGSGFQLESNEAQVVSPIRNATESLGDPVNSLSLPDPDQMDFSQLRAAVANCRKCTLCEGRTRTVFGIGDEKANWLFIGEGPGRNEDAQGEPFVGPAGKLLDNMLSAIGLRRGANAYIANIVKCRPTDANGKDRPPTLQEAAACLPYLERQIALIQPTLIIALGKSAAVSLLKLGPDVPVSGLRGKVHRYAGLPLVVTYHPAYLLRTPVDKKKAWADLCLAMDTHAAATSRV
ncbi:hypothetical protein BH11PSE11_BH11PSE11_35280 [soil metagenome]